MVLLESLPELRTLLRRMGEGGRGVSGGLVLLTGRQRLCRRPAAAGARGRWHGRSAAWPGGRTTSAPSVAAGTEVVAGDVLDPPSLGDALRGVHTAYYLIHSMGTSRDYARERPTGRRVVRAGRAGAPVCSGSSTWAALGQGERLSRHLASRQEVGRILRESGVPTVEFRASIVIGSGSLSFELVRALVEKLPAMVTPSWVDTPTQPIGIEDLVAYLVAALDLPAAGASIYEIGGPDPRLLWRPHAGVRPAPRAQRRVMLRVPVLTPRLSSLWLGLVSPVYAGVGRELIDGVRNETVVRDDPRAPGLHRAPARHPRGARARAGERGPRLRRDPLVGRALLAAVAACWGGVRFGSRRVDSRAAWVALLAGGGVPARSPGSAAGAGWYYGDRLWRLRGLLDLAGRRDPAAARSPGSRTLALGETLDFWRVEAVEPGRLLRLAAEMRLPGRAWLQFEVTPENGGSLIRQTALFDPVGLSGLVYWYGAVGDPPARLRRHAAQHRPRRRARRRCRSRHAGTAACPALGEVLIALRKMLQVAR